MKAKVLIINRHFFLNIKKLKEEIKHDFPHAEIFVLSLDYIKNVIFKLSSKTKEKGIFYIILPFSIHYIRNPVYWINILLLAFNKCYTLSLVTSSGIKVSTSLILQKLSGIIQNMTGIIYTFAKRIIEEIILGHNPIISILIIFRLPYYVITQVIGKFVLSKESPKDESIGFGRGKDVGGLIYWHAITKRIDRFGLFGLVSNSYMGFPLSVHSWPISILILKSIGYRKFVYLSSLLLGFGLSWVSLLSGNSYMLALIPLILFSTYYIFNIYSSTLEILAWGFGFLAFAAFFANFQILAGILLAASVLSHPGASMLIGITTFLFGFLDGRPLADIVYMGITTGIFVIWWLIPYWRSRDKLGRDIMINKIWQYPYSWSPETIYQGLIFSVFILMNIIEGGHEYVLLILPLPLFVLYFNVKKRWVFSQYTIYNFVLFIGGIYSCINPNIFSIITFLLMIYTCGEVIWRNSDSCWGFDLTPVKVGPSRERVVELFDSLKPGRIALEMEMSKFQITSNFASYLDYILADLDVDLLNTAYAEIGDHQILNNYCMYINAETTRDQFESICKKIGIQYIVSFTDEFQQELLRRGYKLIGTLSDIHFSANPNKKNVLNIITLFELPWKASIIEPETVIEVSYNEIKFFAEANQDYFLSYSAFKGWRAFQKGESIEIKDAQPGLLIKAEHDGEVIVRYSYHNYWTSFFSNHITRKKLR